MKALLAGTEIKVVAEATTGQAAVKIALEKAVNLVLLDVRIPDGDGLTVLARIKLEKPDMPVLLFSAFDNPASVARSIALGADGFLLKGCSRDELLNTIRSAAAGESVWSNEKLRSVSGTLRTPRLAGSLEASLSDARRSAAADRPRSDQQADRRGDESHLRHRHGAHSTHLSQDRPAGPHTGCLVGGGNDLV